MGKIEHFFELWAKILSLVFLLTATGLVSFNVVARYAFNYGVPWCEEAIRYSVIFATFFGLSLAVSKNESIKIDLLLQILQGKSLFCVNIIGTFLEFGTLLALFVFSVKLVKETYVTGQITPSTDFPMYIPYIVVALGSLFCLVRSLEAMREAIKKR